jgi:hypothetical protein
MDAACHVRIIGVGVLRDSQQSPTFQLSWTLR